MSHAHSMNARKCVHAQKPYSCQVFAHEIMNQARLEDEEKERKKDSGHEADRKKGSPTKQKCI